MASGFGCGHAKLIVFYSTIFTQHWINNKNVNVNALSTVQHLTMLHLSKAGGSKEKEEKEIIIKRFIVLLQGFLKVREVSETFWEAASWRTGCYAPPQLTCILYESLTCPPHGHFRAENLHHIKKLLNF